LAVSASFCRLISVKHLLCVAIAAVNFVAILPGEAGEIEKPKVASEADLPQFSYPMSLTAQALLTSEPATFRAFAIHVKRDLVSIWQGYVVNDKGILLRLLSDKVDLEMMFGEDAEALRTCEQMRDLVDRPDFKATGMFNDLSFIRARMSTGRSNGEAFQAAYKKDLGTLVESLPWDVVAERVKKTQKKFERLSAEYVTMQVETEIEPYVTAHHALNFALATRLIYWRGTLQTEVPQRQIVLDIINAYIEMHEHSAVPPQ
jgi:hypothetical protein